MATDIQAPVCTTLHPTSKNSPLPIHQAQRMAELFSFLGDANRLRLISLLSERQMCVCDLAAALGMSESAVSHQLRALRVMRLVEYRKLGRRVFYQLQDNHVQTLYKSVLEHINEEDCTDVAH